MTTMNRVHAVTARQHGVIAYAQLLELGWTRAAVRHLVRSGRLRRVHRSVYAPAGLCLAPAGRARAAVMACGDGAALSHFSAAALWDLRDHWPLLPQVTVPNATGSTGPKGIELHHSLTLGVPESVRTATQEYRRSQDTVRLFLEEACLLSDDARVTPTVLRGAYEAFCGRQGLHPVEPRAFVVALEGHGLRQRKSGATRSWRGITVGGGT